MTAPVPPKTEATPETLRSKLPPPAHLAAQVAWTLGWTFLGSLFGLSGTSVGLVASALLSPVAPVIFEHFMQATGIRARQRYRQLRKQHYSDSSARSRVAIEERQHRQRAFTTLHWKVLGISAAIVLLVSAGAITAVEAGVGKPVSDIVQGRQGSGFTWQTQPVTTPPPAPSPSQAPVPPSPPPGTPTPTPLVTPSPSPSVTPAPLVTPSPGASTPAPASSSPAVSPTTPPAAPGG